MSRDWAQFITALEAKGVYFEQVQYATDRQTVIHAAGIHDPLSVAVVETEWQKRHSAPRGSGHSYADPASNGPWTTSTQLRIGKGSLSTPTPGTGQLQLTDATHLANIPEEVQDTVVAGEVLSAALGFGGALIQQNTGGGFVVSSYVPLSMRSLCQAILPVADAFVVLRAAEEVENMGHSSVGMALAETVSEITTSYAHQITKLQRWAEERTMPLMGVVSEIIRVGYHVVRLRQVLPMDLLLPQVNSLASEGTGGMSGPRILNHLCEQGQLFVGSPEDSELLQLLLRRALVPYLRILHRWMHEGVLEDPFGEFFITEAYEPTHPAATASSTQRRHNAASLFPDVSAMADSYRTTSDAQQDVISFERRFAMNKLMIPSFLEKPARVAKMIFFAGKYCCLLREYNDTRPAFGETADDLLTWSGEEALLRKIQESFETASGAVIELLFCSSVDLLGHLSSLRSYFLQERGDWVVNFLDSADELLTRSPDKVRIHSIRVLLQAAIARSCGSDPYHSLIGCAFSDLSLEQHLHRTMRDEESEKMGSPTMRLSTARVEARHCIELLQLEVDLQWPLTLVFDTTVMKRLNSIFRLLTWVKTCERNLSSLWHRNEVLATFSAAYGIKHQLIQFLRQFQFYAAHFVLEPLWSKLIGRIGQCDSVFAISASLSEFFEGVERGLVLSSPHRFRSLCSILSIAERFGEIGLHGGTATMPLIEAMLHTVEDDLLRALSELASPVGQDYPQLVPLLTWIDFSGFYDRNNIYHVQRGVGH